MDALVSVAWLREHRGDGLRVLDATWHLPTAKRDAYAEFLESHIPGAAFFDIDAASDAQSTLPHMLPSARAFAAYAGGLGIAADDTIVVYDTYGMMSAPRVWWMFRAFGHARVAVLDGGLVAWRASGAPVAHGEHVVSPVPYAIPVLDRARVRDRAAMRDNVATGREIVIDARSAARFRGEVDEPRAGLRRGHIPQSRNLPFDTLVDAGSKCLLPDAALRARFAEAGIDLARPLAFTCGSGITACVDAFVAERLGVRHVAVYDGSWAEWGADASLPIA